MTERLRIYRCEPGPPDSPFGVLFGWDDRARPKYVLPPRHVVIDRTPGARPIADRAIADGQRGSALRPLRLKFCRK